MKVELAKLERNDMMMVQLMCNVILKDRKQNKLHTMGVDQGDFDMLKEWTKTVGERSVNRL